MAGLVRCSSLPATLATLATLAVARPSTANEGSHRSAEPVRGPAKDLIVEAAGGYGVGALTAVAGHDPKVLHGPVFHLALGWAWSINAGQSVGLELFADGMFDGKRTTGGSTRVGGRYGASAFVIGERAHVRLGAGWARTRMDGSDYGGLGVAFAAGWHFAMAPTAKTWKRPYVTFDVVPNVDFLNAGDETLLRLGFGMQLGVALY